MSITLPIVAASAAVCGVISVLGDRFLDKGGVWGVMRLLVPVATLATTVSSTENYVYSASLFCLTFAAVVGIGRRLMGSSQVKTRLRLKLLESGTVRES